MPSVEDCVIELKRIQDLQQTIKNSEIKEEISRLKEEADSCLEVEKEYRDKINKEALLELRESKAIQDLGFSPIHLEELEFLSERKSRFSRFPKFMLFNTTEDISTIYTRVHTKVEKVKELFYIYPSPPHLKKISALVCSITFVSVFALLTVAGNANLIYNIMGSFTIATAVAVILTAAHGRNNLSSSYWYPFALDRNSRELVSSLNHVRNYGLNIGLICEARKSFRAEPVDPNSILVVYGEKYLAYVHHFSSKSIEIEIEERITK